VALVMPRAAVSRRTGSAPTGVVANQHHQPRHPALKILGRPASVMQRC
jgi:hypothetical protein